MASATRMLNGERNRFLPTCVPASLSYRREAKSLRAVVGVSMPDCPLSLDARCGEGAADELLHPQLGGDLRHPFGRLPAGHPPGVLQKAGRLNSVRLESCW